MKELSIEEKAKAYDEAIKRAQAKMEEAKVFDYDDEQTSYTIRLTTTDIFPELAESEDERIRKVLIDYFDSANKGDENPLMLYGIQTDKVITWLKRQGEQKDLTDRFFEGFKQGEKCVIENYGKYGLQKSVNSTLDEKDEMDSAFTKMMENEQKSAEWSKNDRKIIEKLITIVDAKEYKNEVEWLISLYDRTIPQPKQEWSGEDEDMFKKFVSLIPQCMTAHSYNEYFNWLKSLKDKYTWKPSDEQMKALYSVAFCHVQRNQNLESLYNELDKLK